MSDLKNNIGKIGVFFNFNDEKRIVISRLKEVTKNGNCLDEEDIYYDFFEPKTQLEIFDKIKELYKTHNP